MEDRHFAQYLERLRSQVADAALDVPLPGEYVVPAMFGEQAFTEVISAFLTDRGQLNDAELCYLDMRMGRGIAKVNGWCLDEENRTVTLLTTLFRGLPTPATVGASEINAAVERAARVISEAKNAFHKRMEPASCSFDMMERLHNAIPEVTRARIVVLVDGFASPAAKAAPEYSATGLKIDIDVWDIRRLFRLEASGLPYEALEIDLRERLGAPLSCIRAPTSTSGFEVYLAIVPGDLLHDLYDEHGPRLLELNVRSFLQARGKVNRGIRDTLREEPERFLAYNNGISATAEWVKVTEGPRGLGIEKVRGLQVVNGGQTVASIHRAKDRDRQDLSAVNVQAKLTVIPQEQLDELVPSISRFANTQNRVNDADFSANHPFHVRLQQLSQTVWTPGQQSKWFFERARGQYEVAQQREGSTPARLARFKQANPPQQRFDKVDLAKVINSWEQLPHIVGRGGQKNFIAFMQLLDNRHGRDWEPGQSYFQDSIAKVIIYKNAESAARLLKLPGYRANAVAYTVALLSYRTAGRIDLQSVWAEQRVSNALAETLLTWMSTVYHELVDTAQGRNVTEWCKREECWRQVQLVNVTFPSALDEELAQGQPMPTVGSGRSGGPLLSAEDRENIARVMQVEAAVWVHVSGWGARSGHLADWQSGIAATLASYAAGGWSRVPSEKQALHGTRILRIAQELGGMPPEVD